MLDKICDRSSVVEQPIPVGTDGGSKPTRSLHIPRPPLIDIRQIDHGVARDFVKLWHSRLPVSPHGATVAFGAYFRSELEAVALWGNCSARNLPQDWRELRRLAISDFAPKNTATIMLGWMVRWHKKNTTAPTLISYQDLGVHKGTIYRASNWTPVAIGRPRLRGREVSDQPWTKTRKMYRSNEVHSKSAIASAKVRWQYSLVGEKFVALTAKDIEAALKMKPTK